MTNLTKNLTIAAAAMMVAAGVAGAATIKAEVPFGFQANGSNMSAGSYTVVANRESGSLILKVRNDDTHRSIMTVPYAENIQKSGEPEASLTFECTGSNCALVKVAAGTGRSFQIWKAKAEKDGDTRVAVIRAVLVR
jgi:hypothetical protein